VRTWLKSQEPQGKGLVAFSCSPRGLWQAEILQVRAMPHVVFAPQPDVAPLLELIDEHERYAVAMLHAERVRLVTVFLGEIEDAEDIDGPLARVAQRIAEREQDRRFNRLILVGPEEATTELRRVLPRTVDERVAAVIAADGALDDRALLATAVDVEREVERLAEERLVRQLIEQVDRGRSILGVRPTLAALWANTVQTLVVAQSVRGDGSECPSCWRLEPGRIETCPKCGNRMAPVHDVFHRAMERAAELAGRTEVVFGDAERQLYRVGGGLGALLRAA
jgi:peptide subunit release factor 1 (eRF1)